MIEKRLHLKSRDDRKKTLKLSHNLINKKSYTNEKIEVLGYDSSMFETTALTYMFTLRKIELPLNIKEIIDEHLKGVRILDEDDSFILIGSDIEQLNKITPYISLLHNSYKDYRCSVI